MAKIAEALHAMGVIVIVDGAHAPGHLSLGENSRSVQMFGTLEGAVALLTNSCAVVEEMG